MLPAFQRPARALRARSRPVKSTPTPEPARCRSRSHPASAAPLLKIAAPHLRVPRGGLVVIAQVYTLSGGEKQRLASSSCSIRRHRRSIAPARIEVFHDRKIRLERQRAGRSSQPTFTRSITKTSPERTGVSFIALRGVASLSIARGRDDERPACYGYHFSASRLGPSVQGDVNVMSLAQ